MIERLKLRLFGCSVDYEGFPVARVIYKGSKGVEVWLYPELLDERIYLEPAQARELGRALIGAAQVPEVERSVAAARRQFPFIFLGTLGVAVLDWATGWIPGFTPKGWAALLLIIVLAYAVTLYDGHRAKKYRCGRWIT